MGNSISENVRELLDRWLKARDNRSLQVLADLTGIRYNTLRRIHIGQVEPSLESCLSLLNYVASPDEAAYFVNKNFPEAGKFYQRLADRDNRVTFAADIREEWRDFQSFIVISLSMMKLATIENIKKFLGDAGLVTADALARKGIVVWGEDEVMMRDGSELCVSQDPQTTLTVLEHLVSIFRARGENPFVNLVNVSEQDAETLRKMSQQFSREAAAIIDRSEGGEIVALSLMYANLTKGLV